MNRKILLVIPLIFLALVLGTYDGLIRIGWDLPMNQSVAQHGVVMVGSFLVTLILLERIVIFKKTWLYIFPVLNGLSFLFFFTGKYHTGLQLLLIGSGALASIYVYLYVLHREAFLLIMLIGTIALTGGYIMLINLNLYPAAVPFWFAFITFTVIGERLELARFLPQGHFKNNFLLLTIALYFAGLLFNYHGSGHLLSGLSMILMTLWLARFDIALKSVKMKGLHRYIASNLIAGYFWLAVTGILLFFAPVYSLVYDATLHAFFIGFMFSMIFAHGPIILPGVAGILKRPYHPVLYAWGAILQFSLVMRIACDFMEWTKLREFSSLVNVITVLGFFINVFILMIAGAREPAKKPA